MENCNQEGDIINRSDLEHIMADLSQDNQNFSVFLEQEEYVDINQMCDSTQEVKRETINSNEGSIICCLANCDTNVTLSTGITPSIADYPGPYNFEISMANSAYRRGSWVYSSKLKKVFIDVDKVMLVKFKVDSSCPLGLRIRALLVYPAPDHMNRAVSRCTLHKFNLDPNHQAHARSDVCLCQDYNLVGHVLVTDHANAIFEYNPESERHSVLVPLGLPQPGSDSVTIAYQFGCKNSCPGGMSRRAVNIIFTLETPSGAVLGRKRLSVKVCSCPKRDKEREEHEFDKGSLPVSETSHSRRRGGSSNSKESNIINNKRIKCEPQPYEDEDIKPFLIKTEVFDRLSNQINQFQQTFGVLMNQLAGLQEVLQSIDKILKKKS